MKPKINIIVKDIDRVQWYAFLAYCKMNDTTGTQEIKKIVSTYIEKLGKE